MKSTNMHLEGLLSEVKASVPKGKRARHAEKLAYTSHLARLLKQHIARGREDCRGEDRRRTLLSRGAPVEGLNRPGANRPDIRWRNFKLAQWKLQHRDASAAALAQQTSELHRQWREYSDDERTAALLAADAAMPASEDDLPVEETGPEEHPDMWDCGDRAWPLRADVLGTFIHTHPAHVTKGVPGVARKAGLIRNAEQDHLVIREKGDVPADRVYTHRHSCGEAHPGLCALQDREVYADTIKLAKNLERCLDSTFHHRFFCIVAPDLAAQRNTFLYLARARPRRFHAQVTHVLVRCVQHHEEGRLLLSLGQRQFRLWDVVTLWTVAKELLRAGGNRLHLQRMHHCHEDHATVSVQLEEPTYPVWPNFERHRQQRPMDDPPLPDAQHRPRRRGRGTGGVKVVPPQATFLLQGFDHGGVGIPPAAGVDAALVPGSELRSSSEASSSDPDAEPASDGGPVGEQGVANAAAGQGEPDHDLDALSTPSRSRSPRRSGEDLGIEPAVVEQPQPVQDPAGYAPRPRESRGEPFGSLFTLASVHPGGVITAWSATCRRHQSDGHRCNTSLTFGEVFSEDEAKRRIKRWCLQGLEIPDEAGGRDRHMKINPRRFRASDVGTHEELDRAVPV